jgi:thiamine-monophosphate kinase
MLVERVHFLPGVSPRPLGRRALAVNISDVAAMGGSPRAALTSLALPPSMTEQWLAELYSGIAEEAASFGVAVAGGNLSRTDGPVCIDVTVLGSVPKDQLLTRSGARPGDVLGVTGVLGGEAARRALAPADPEIAVPTPRVAAARALAATGRVHAMMDISDGLAGDLRHLARASKVGAVLYAEQIPVAIAARQAGHDLGIDPLSLALDGGEDYELLLAAPEDDWGELVAAVGDDASLYRVGTVLGADEGVQLERLGGNREPLPDGGWSHF